MTAAQRSVVSIETPLLFLFLVCGRARAQNPDPKLIEGLVKLYDSFSRCDENEKRPKPKLAG